MQNSFFWKIPTGQAVVHCEGASILIQLDPGPKQVSWSILKLVASTWKFQRPITQHTNKWTQNWPESPKRIQINTKPDLVRWCWTTILETTKELSDQQYLWFFEETKKNLLGIKHLEVKPLGISLFKINQMSAHDQRS